MNFETFFQTDIGFDILLDRDQQQVYIPDCALANLLNVEIHEIKDLLKRCNQPILKNALLMKNGVLFFDNVKWTDSEGVSHVCRLYSLATASYALSVAALSGNSSAAIVLALGWSCFSKNETQS